MADHADPADADPADLTDADYQALARFRHALRLFLRFSEDAARTAGLTPNQHQLLLAVRGWPGAEGPTVGDVAEQLQLRHHSVVELVDRAERAELVTRATDGADRRRQRIHLTAGGDRQLARLTALHRAEIRRFRDDMAEALAGLD